MAAFVLRPELAREAVRHFLFNEYVDLSFFPLFFKLSVTIILYNKNKPVFSAEKSNRWKRVQRLHS